MQQKQRKKILWLSDYANSGFGVVAKNLLREIATQSDDYEITVVGINFYDGGDKTDKQKEPLQLYDGKVMVIDGRFAKNEEVPYDPFCRMCFLELLRDMPEPFDGVFIFGDYGNNTFSDIPPSLNFLKNEFKKVNRKQFKSIFYTPIDGNIPKSVFRNIEGFDKLITYNNYSREVIAKARPELRKDIKIIPHGVNTKDFYPIPKDEIRAFREEYFGKENADKIIFVNVNRNQPRKSLPDTIFAFIEAKEMNDTGKELFLYLHCAKADNMGNDLPAIFEQTDLKEGVDYKLCSDEYWEKQYGVETSMLNKIYNASDIYVTTTLGEGWGLSVTEAMACRLPTILPMHTSFLEIGDNGKRCYPMWDLFKCVLNKESFIRERTDYLSVAETMIQAAQHQIDGYGKGMLDRAENYVKGLTWKGIAKQFLNYFKETY